MVKYEKGWWAMTEIKDSIQKDFEKLRSNKNEYLDTFYENNYITVYKVCYSILKNKENSEDVAQSVFEKILKLDCEKLPTEYEASWLYTVTKNECLQFLRKRKIDFADENLENIENDKSDIENFIDNENFNRIIKKLNKKQEQIVQLKIASEFTFKEIGEMLSMPTATVQWYYYSSMKSLKVALSNMAMFIISLVIGIKFIAKKDVDNELNKSISNIHSDVNTHINEESEISSKSSINSIDVSSVQKDLSEITACDVYDSNYTSYKKNYGVFVIPAIFLIISVVFFIVFAKHCKKKK